MHETLKPPHQPAREMSLSDRLHAIDLRQQRTPGVRLVAAVIKKAGDDQTGQLAALISYYAFVSLFPLLLVLVTVLGFVLQNNPSEREKILAGTLGQIPLISDSINVQTLTGSDLALVVGIVGALLAGMGITNATQNAFNRIWGVPFKARPNYIKLRLRGLGMLAILGRSRSSRPSQQATSGLPATAPPRWPPASCSPLSRTWPCS